MTPYKLGKKDARPDARDIRLRDIVDVELVTRKPYVPHDKGYVRNMYANGPDPTAPIDPATGKPVIVGDCELGRASNAIQQTRHIAGLPAARLNGATAVAAYSEVTGYVIGDESTDQGTDMRVSANWLRKTGLKDLDGKRHKIAAYATFDPSNPVELDAAVKTFDFAGLGVQLQQAQEQAFPREWKYVATSPTVGGHAINYCAPERIDSWGSEVQVDKPFIQHCADEGFVYITLEIFNEQHQTPEGLDLAALKRALAAL